MAKAYKILTLNAISAKGLARLPQSRLAARSSLYTSAPVGYAAQPDFINAVAALETRLSPRALLEAMLGIEHHHGRNRTFRNAPRTLDLDLLLYGEAHFHEENLTLPHPRMHERAFVLLPLLEIAPGLVIPGQGSAAALLNLYGEQSVQRHTPPLQVAGEAA